MNKKFICFLALMLMMSFATLDTTAQSPRCKFCQTNGLTFFCANTTQQNQVGGCSCSGGISCQLETPCSPRFPCNEVLANKNASGILFDEKSILEIAQQFPRMAVSLITLNNNGGLKDRSIIYTPAVDINASEVFNWKTSDKENLESKKAFLEELEKRLDPNQESPSIFFGFSEVDNSNVVIKGTVMNSFSKDPKYSGIIIKIVAGKIVSWNLEKS